MIVDVIFAGTALLRQAQALRREVTTLYSFITVRKQFRKLANSTAQISGAIAGLRTGELVDELGNNLIGIQIINTHHLSCIVLQRFVPVCTIHSITSAHADQIV